MAERNTGARPVSAHACYKKCLSGGLSIRMMNRKQALGEDGTGSRIGSIKTSQMAAINTGARPVSAHACYKKRLSGGLSIHTKNRKHALGEDGTGSRIGSIKTSRMAAINTGVSARALLLCSMHVLWDGRQQR